MKDIIIIGSGVIGSSIAREVARYQASVLVLEKAFDLCEGATKANSAIIHSGLDAKPGTKKAYYNVLGNKMYDDVKKELGVKLYRNGSLNIAFDEDGLPGLEELLERGKKNGVEGLKIVDRAYLDEHEPNLRKTIPYALLAPTAGIVDSFEINIAFAQNAATNGVEFKFDQEVVDIQKIEGGYKVITQDSEYEAKVVINCAGIHSDEINNLVSDDKITITARRGEYYLLDKYEKDLVKHTIFQQPTERGKGVLVAPTVSDNIIVGPNAHAVEKDDNVTTAEGLREVAEMASHSVENIPIRSAITSFAGLRATGHTGDFILGEAVDAPGFYNCAGIESPGLTAAPAIAKDVAKWAKEYLNLEENPDYNPIRKRPTILMELSDEEKDELIKKEPGYGRIVCRCEWISEQEVINAITGPVGARSLDGIKRRTRAGSGRCQAGFCMPKQIELLMKHHGMKMEDVTKFGKGSKLVVGKIKGQFKESSHE